MSTSCEYFLIIFLRNGLTSAAGNSTFKRYVDSLLTIISQILTLCVQNRTELVYREVSVFA